MKSMKYFLLAGLVCTSGAFAFSDTTFINKTNVCIWTSYPNTPDNYDAYPILANYTQSISANTLLTACEKGASTCTATLSWSKVGSNGRCTYGRDNIHTLDVKEIWNSVNPGVSYLTLSATPKYADGLRFETTPNADTITIEGNIAN